VVVQHPEALADEFAGGQLSLTGCRTVLHRLHAAPAIGTFYLHLAPGEDSIRVDAPAGAFGMGDRHLLDFAYERLSYQMALPMVSRLIGDYGGMSVYNAALYVVDQEVRLHAETMDRIYLAVLHHQIGLPIQYDRPTRRFCTEVGNDAQVRNK
jgi:hypothetical protein